MNEKYKKLYYAFISILESLVQEEISDSGHCQLSQGLTIHNASNLSEEIKNTCDMENLTKQEKLVLSTAKKQPYQLFVVTDDGQLFNVDKIDGVSELLENINEQQLIYLFQKLN